MPGKRSRNECTLFHSCPQCRFIPEDGGLFQRIPYHADGILEAHDIRKNCERPFNLLKNQTGLETVRVRSQPATMARCTLVCIILVPIFEITLQGICSIDHKLSFQFIVIRSIPTTTNGLVQADQIRGHFCIARGQTVLLDKQGALGIKHIVEIT